MEADPANLLNVYDLALAYLAAGPTEDDVNGLFFIARASNLAQGWRQRADRQVRQEQVHEVSRQRRGMERCAGARRATTTLPPADFTIKKYVPPTPAEQAAELVKSKKVEEMSFAEWQMVSFRRHARRRRQGVELC